VPVDLQKMNLPDVNHPIWSLIKTTLLIVALGLVLNFNYNTFDWTKDPRAMLLIAICGYSLDITQFFAAKKAKE
jgi:nitrate reductase gamma subunit